MYHSTLGSSVIKKKKRGFPFSHTLSLSRSLSRSHTPGVDKSGGNGPLFLSHTHTLTLSFSLTLNLTHAHTHSLAHTLSLSLSLFHFLSLSLSHTHKHTRTLQVLTDPGIAVFDGLSTADFYKFRGSVCPLPCLTQSVFEVVLQKSASPRIHQRVLDYNQ